QARRPRRPADAATPGDEAAAASAADRHGAGPANQGRAERPVPVRVGEEGEEVLCWVKGGDSGKSGVLIPAARLGGLAAGDADPRRPWAARGHYASTAGPP